MTTPDPLVFVERWVNSHATATVAAEQAGGAGLQQTAQNWAMGGGYAAFPAADAVSGAPQTLFRIFDPADPREIMRVQQTSGAAWTVVRGDQGTLPVLHKPGFTVRPFITAAGLGALAQGVPSRNGLVLPNRRIPWPSVPVTDYNSYYAVCALDFPGPEISRGCTYEMLTWGRYTLGVSRPTDPGFGPSFNVGCYYSGYTNGPPGEESHVGQMKCPFFGATPANARFRIHAILSFYPGQATSSITVYLSPGGDDRLPMQARMFGPSSQFPSNTSSGSQSIATSLLLNAEAISSFTIGGAKAWRSA